MRPEPDETLMRRVADGDHDACRTLVVRHVDRIHRFATRTLGNEAEAEDVTQEVFLRLWSHAARWRPDAKLTTWLHRVATNLCIDRMRQRREESMDSVPEPPDPRPGAATQIGSEQLRQHLQHAIDGLPDRQRIALTLCHYQGLSNIDAAAALDVSVEALESLLARGRRRLREQLRPRMGDLLGD